jgi:hypothetical protein
MDPISVNEVVAGDILLYHGDGLISKLIRFWDGTEVNHAAICIGNGKTGEAQAKGLSRSTIDAGLKSPEYVIVRRLKSIPDTMQPVVDKAEYYLDIGNRYAYEQILLLGFLGISRKLRANTCLKWLLRKLLDQAADWLTANGDKQPMICSEYVYRCYDEALPAEHDPYTLNIDPLPVAAAGGTRGVRSTTRPAPNNNIHRDSLLAWVDEITSSRDRAAFSSLLRSIREAPTRKTIRPLSAEEKKISSMPLDDLIDQYLQETRKPITRSLAQDASLRSPEMLASIEKFGAALYAADKPTPASEKRRLRRGPEDQVADHLSHLLKTAADFVTPGDLLKCIDLDSIGKIMPKTQESLES